MVDHETLTSRASDGTTLSAERWQPERVVAEALILPGYGDHAGRYHELAHRFAALGIATVALDPRGHGKSSGKRGYVDAWTDYLADVDAAVAWLSHETRFVLGHSQGATIALDWVATRRPALRGLILTNPFLDLSMKVPAVKLAIGKLAGRILPKLTMANELDPAAMSDDPTMVEDYARDPLVFKVTTARWFVELLQAQSRVRALREVTAPLLYIYSPEDRVVSGAANRELSAQLSSSDKTVWQHGGKHHEVLNEVAREKLHTQIGEWIVAHT